MNIFNLIRFVCLVLLMVITGAEGYGGPEREVAIPCHLRTPRTSGPLPERFIIDRLEHPLKQQCLDDIEEALIFGANPNCPIDVSRFGLGDLTPMEIALRSTDCGLLEVLLRQGVPLTGKQIVSHCITGKHGINMPLLIKLVASTANSSELASQIRNELRQHDAFVATP